jgi:DNA (cytosine-5)-methyltransferase 1
MPKLLDLFCGAGGAGEGYRRAGFDVTGIDVKPQKNNPHTFIQADALEYAERHWHEYDAIHASPGTANLLYETLDFVKTINIPWVIENVVGAPLPSAIILCGASFGLGASGYDLSRHRLFQCSFFFGSPMSA